MADLSDQDRDEIERDLATQGLDYAVTADDVAATFNLYETFQVPDDDPVPSPAFGPDWQYTPEPGEEEIFADTEGMYLPPAADQEIGPSQPGEPLM